MENMTDKRKKSIKDAKGVDDFVGTEKIEDVKEDLTEKDSGDSIEI